MTVLDDLANYVDTNSTAFTVGTTAGNLSIEQALDTMPDTLVTLYETGGLAPLFAFSTGNIAQVVFERPNIQAVSRSASAVTARTQIQTLYTLLNGLTNTTMSGTRYAEIAAVQPPFQLGRDNNERHQWAVNFTVKKDP